MLIESCSEAALGKKKKKAILLCPLLEKRSNAQPYTGVVVAGYMVCLVE